MSAPSRSVPSATHLLAESVRRYRGGFSGVARAFLPVFAVFAAGQIGLALAGDPADFNGYVLRALALAAVGVAELVLQVIATAGLIAHLDDLPRASVAAIYRSGARAFWSVTWVSALAALALSAVPLVTLAVTPFLTRAAAATAAALSGRSFDAAVTAALATAAVAAVAALAASVALLLRLAFAFPLAAVGRTRGLPALEASAGLSEGRAWAVLGRLAAGALAATAVAAPFACIVAASARAVAGSFAAGLGSAWAWALFAGGYLLVVVPFFAIFLTELGRVLSDTAAERALARERRPWVRGFVWAGAAAWAVSVVGSLFN